MTATDSLTQPNLFPVSPQVAAQPNLESLVDRYLGAYVGVFELMQQDTELNQGVRPTSPCSFES